MKLMKKILTGLMVFLVALGSSPLEVFAYDPYKDFPDQNQREWPTQNYNNVATTLPDPPAVPNTVNMADMFHYPELIYTGSESWFPDQTAKLANNRSYVTASDSSVAVITRDARWQSGVMWSLEENKIKLNEPFHMVAYVYLGERTQYNRNFSKLGGADGITFTMHNDLKQPSDMQAGNKLASGSLGNTGINAYGALGNGLGVYGSNFSANVSSDKNNMVDFWRGVENGITLEFDTFYNDNDTTQHSDNDLTTIIYNENHVNTQYGHIAINILNDFKDNRANRNVEPDKTTNKHNIKLSLGWNGEVSEKTNPYRWNISNWPTTNLADGKWHRLEVIWTPDTATNTGKLNYKIYKQGHEGSRNIEYSNDSSKDGTDFISYDVAIGSPEYSLQRVFGVNDLNNSVYWGFSGSTGGFLNNQAVQMVQLPISYYEAELRKEDQEGDLITDATFNLEKYDASTGEWSTEQFYNPDTGNWVTNLQTGSQDDYVGIYGGVFQSLGKIKLTQLTEGTYRWKEVAPPEGYQLGQVYWPSESGFEVNYAISQQSNNLITVTATNKKLYQLELTKTDSDTQNPLNDVPFIISKTENEENDKQYYLKVNADSTGFEWTEVETDAKQFLTGKSYLLGQDGHVTEQPGDAGKITVRYFPDAPNLSWKEVSVPAGYDSSGTLTGVFTPSTDNKYVYSASQTNSRLYQVSLEKKASDTNAALPGAVFSLQKKDDQNWETVSQDGVSEFTTNSEGKISISNLTAGTYRWEEKQAPVGYKIKQQYYPDENGFEVNYREGLDIDEISQNYKYDPTQVTNEPQDFELILEKLSSTFQRPLENVSFTLYRNREGNTFSNEITTQKTNTEGKIVFDSNLIKADKTYYLVESQTVDGFIQLKGYFTITTSKADGINVTYVKADTETDANPFEFTKKEGDIYSGQLKIYNKRKSILPTTGGNGIIQYITIGLSMIAVAFLFLLARKRMLKWFIVLLVSTAGLMGLNSGTQKVLAQENNQVTFEVHRLVYQPSDTQYKSGVAVPGAELEILDVTETFYDLVSNQQLTPKNAQERLRDSSDVNGKSVTTAVTNQSGIVNFSVAKINNQRPAVYLIRETVTPVAVTKMESLVVVLPILDDEGNEKSVIPLYPKSHGTFTFDKTIDEKQSSYSFGEPIDYRLSTIIPQDIATLSSYEIEDIYDKGLQFIPDSLVIFVDGQEQKDITKAVNLSENQFRVVFDVAKLAQFGGKKIEITYNMVIKDTAAIDQDLVNTATLYPGDLTPLVDRENVRTGGFRFIKRAAEGKQNPLAEATFVIKNPTNDAVLTYKEGKYQFEKVATNASGVVRLTSDDEGYFEIKGLRYGEYLVSEVRAPSGYVLNDKPTTFTVDVSTYTDGPVLSIINVKKPKIRLPETGVVVTSTAFVGLFIMASSLVMIRRKNDK
ncbi:SpaH/EbpB family LPXTG-anchored major pilin [Streptococcus suis]|nr:SpaH/EbpB family LPXTG-anchored major pilin [Streptococcus suis]